MKAELRNAIPKLVCGNERATAFMASNKIAFTATHAIIDHFTKGKTIKLIFNLDCQETVEINANPRPIDNENWRNQSIMALELENEIESIIPLKCIDHRFIDDSFKYKTFGYIPSREDEGTPVNIYVLTENIAEDYTKLKKTWNLDLKKDDYAKGYEGLSGGPLLIDDCVCAILLDETLEDGEASRLAGVNINLYKNYLGDLGIKIVSNKDIKEKLDSEYVKIGITNFQDGVEEIKKHTNKILDLTRFFDGRHIKGNYWDDILDKLCEFVEGMDSEYKYILYIETILSIAFILGHLLHSKTRIKVFPIQNTSLEREFWYPTEDPNANYKDLKIKEFSFSKETKDIALVLGLTRDILNDVNGYIQKEQLNISKVISCTVDGYIGNDSIIDGKHAIRLANNIAAAVDRRTEEEKMNNLHIFASCPVSLMFYLGKLSKSFKRVILYEYDLEGYGGYSKSVQLPINFENI